MMNNTELLKKMREKKEETGFTEEELKFLETLVCRDEDKSPIVICKNSSPDYRCAICKEPLSIFQRFCDRCGQRIFWDEEAV